MLAAGAQRYARLAVDEWANEITASARSLRSTRPARAFTQWLPCSWGVGRSNGMDQLERNDDRSKSEHRSWAAASGEASDGSPLPSRQHSDIVP
jgi:hypothetical protein